MFTSTQITSRLCPSHHCLLIQCNLMSCDSQQYRQNILNNKCTRTLIIRRHYSDEYQFWLNNHYTLTHHNSSRLCDSTHLASGKGVHIVINPSLYLIWIEEIIAHCLNIVVGSGCKLYRIEGVIYFLCSGKIQNGTPFRWNLSVLELPSNYFRNTMLMITIILLTVCWET